MEIEKSFKYSRKEMETGKEYFMPQWASFLAMLSVVIGIPKGYLGPPVIFSLLTLVQYTIEGRISLKVCFAGTLITGLYFIFLVVAISAILRSNEVLDSYMAYIYANNKFPIWLRNKFGLVK